MTDEFDGLSPDLDTGIIEPGLPLLDGCVIATREPVYVLPAGVETTLKFVARNAEGAAHDMTAYFPTDSDSVSEDSENRIEVRFQEVVREARGRPLCGAEEETLIADPVDAANGVFHVAVDAATLELAPGVYTLQFGAFVENRLRKVWRGAMICEPSLYVDETLRLRYPGPPSIVAIRSAIADRSAQDNRVLAAVEFQLEDIVSAYARPVQFYNECPPPFHDTLYTTNVFPFRELWVRGVMGLLYRTAALRRMRDDVPFEMQGVSISEDAFWQQYDAIGTRYWEEFKSHAEALKTAESQKRAVGEMPSPWYGLGQSRPW